MAVSKVDIRLSVSGDAQVKGALAGAEKSLGNVQSAAADASQSLRNLAGAFAGAVTVGAFVKAADSVTILNNQLKLATGSADAAATAYASLFDIAQRSRVSFTELGGTFATISRAAESLHLSQSALLGVTEAIGNAMTISGGSAESMKAALVQLGQGLASGTLRGEELNSILEQTPRLAKALADGLGVPIGALRKLGEEGKLSAEAVITALRSQQSALAAEVAQSATTVGQALQQLQNAVTVAVGDFDKASGSTGALATGIQAVATTIGELRRAFSGLEESKTDFTAFGEGVGAVMRTMTLGFTTTLTGIRQLGVGAAGLAAAGVALASGNLAGAREAMRAAGEDIDLLGSKWMAQSDAIINSAGSVARATEVNAQAVARLARQGSASAESVKPLDFSKLVGGVDKAKKQVDEFAAALSKVTAKDVGLNADYEKTMAALYSGFVKGRIGVDAYAEAVESLIKQQPFYIAGVRDAAEAEKDRIKALDEASKATAQYYDALQKELGALEANIEKLTLENEQIGLSKEAVVQLTLARMDEAIATEEQTLSMLTLHEAAGEEIKLIERRIALMKQERSLTASNSTKQTTADAAKDAAKEWEKTSDKINDTLTDALMRGFESGKDFAKNMRDTVVNMFKTMVLRPVISAIVNPVAGAITGSLGLAGNANASTGGIGNITNLFSGGGDMLGSIGSAVFGNSAAYGAALGTSSIGAGSQAAMLAAQTGEFGLAGLTATSGAAGGAMASIGAAMPWIGGALAIASLLKGMDDSGTMHTGGLAQYSAAGGTQTSTQHGAFGMGFGGVDYGQAGTALASVMAQTIVGMLDTTATTFGKEAGYTAAAAFADDTSKDGAWGGLLIKNAQGNAEVNWNDTRTSRWAPREFADGEAGAKEYAAAVAKDVRNLLIEQTPEWADTMLNALGDAPTLEQLAVTVAQVNEVATALKFMGQASEAFAGMSESATSALMAAMGGAQAATAKLGSYYGAFYTEAERTALATTALTSDMAAFGKVMPATREEFRGMVDAAIAGGDTALAANLLNVADRFAAVTPAVEASTEALDEFINTAEGAAERFLSGDALKNFKLDRITLKLSEALGTAFSAVDLGNMDVSQIKAAVLGFVNSGAAPAAKTAVIQVGEALLDLREQAKELEDTLLSTADSLADKFLSGDVLKTFKLNRLAAQINEAAGTAFNALDLDAIGIEPLKQMVLAYSQNAEIAPEARIAVMQLGASLLDLKVAAKEAADATAKARADQQLGLQLQIANLNGDTAAIRAHELSLLDGELNQALQKHIWLLEDQKAATEAATAAAEKNAEALRTSTDNAYSALERAVAAQRKTVETQRQAAQDLVQEVTAVFDTLKSNVADLFGEVEDARRFQAAQGRAFITAAITGAKAGTGLPDSKELAEAISAAMAGLSDTVFASQAESDFQRLVLANELKNLQSLSGDQLTEAERQLKLSEDQLQSLDATLETAKSQLDALRGIDTSVISVQAAIDRLGLAMAAEKAGAPAAVQAATEVASTVTDATAANTGTVGSTQAATAASNVNVGGLAAYTTWQSYIKAEQAKPGSTSPPLTDPIWDAPKQAAWTASGLTGLPAFDVGTNYVPRDMIAQIHEGEAIVPKAYNPAANGGEVDSRNNRLESLVEGLTAEVKRLQSIVNDGNTHARRTAETLDNVTEGGSAMRTVAA